MIDFDYSSDEESVALCDGCSQDDAELTVECTMCYRHVSLCQGCFDYRCPCPYCLAGEGEEHDYFEPLDDQQDDEDDVEKELLPTLGIAEINDDKPSLSEFLAMLNDLARGIDSLTGEEGLDLEIFEERVELLDELFATITTLLAKSSPVKGAYRYINEKCDLGPTAIYGLIRDYDPCLLHASFVLRACHQMLIARATRKSRPYPLPPKLVAPCPYTKQEMVTVAKGGRILVRLFKKHLAYQRIWAGKKWISGKLTASLGAKRRGKAATEIAQRKMNPIRALSRQNLERLKQALLDNAKSVFDVDLVAERRKIIEQRQTSLADQLTIAQRTFLDLQFQFAQIESTLQHQMETDDVSRYRNELRSKRDAAQRTVEQIQKSVALLKAEHADEPTLRAMGVMPDELELFSAVINLPFTIKHATPNWYCIANDGSLDSLVEFQNKNPNWKSEFSTPGNVSKLGNHGFVFFRVDVGLDPIATRYGGTQVMDDLSVIEEDGWISLFDQLKPLSSKTIECSYDHQGALIRHAKVKGTNGINQVYEYGWIPPRTSGKKTKQATSFSKSNMKAFKSVGAERYASLDRTEDFKNFVFYGPQIRLGLTLSLLFELRMFHACGYREHIFQSFAELKEEGARTLFLKTLIGQLFRPEGKYPVALRFTEHPVNEMSVVNPVGDGRWRAEGVSNPEIMKDILVIQRRKFIQEALPQAKKTYFFHRKQATQGDVSKRDEQAKKAKARKEEWDMYKEELPLIEKAYNGVARRNPQLIVSEDDAPSKGTTLGLGLASFVKKAESRRKTNSLLLASRGILTRTDKDLPGTVRYQFGKCFVVISVPDDGNCFFHCCAKKKDDGDHLFQRARLARSRHIDDQERARIGTVGNYVTLEDITAMAKEINLTICVHKCSQTSNVTTPVIVHIGNGNDELHVLFLYNPRDGLGHIMPMSPQSEPSSVAKAENPFAMSSWSPPSSLGLLPTEPQGTSPRMMPCDVCHQTKDTASYPCKCHGAGCTGHFYVCRFSDCQRKYFLVRDATGDGENKCMTCLQAEGANWSG